MRSPASWWRPATAAAAGTPSASTRTSSPPPGWRYRTPSPTACAARVSAPTRMPSDYLTGPARSPAPRVFHHRMIYTANAVRAFRACPVKEFPVDANAARSSFGARYADRDAFGHPGHPPQVAVDGFGGSRGRR
ncbi:hypothetical protein FMEAI12_3160007 [Parafrankia sp. Ea1.12]|nr:hypothetical protein FMEAI12_3160007 [Parafrankia sp. Ea1.12]